MIIFYYERVGVVFDYADIVFELQMYAQKRNICADLALELYIVTTLIYWVSRQILTTYIQYNPHPSPRRRKTMIFFQKQTSKISWHCPFKQKMGKSDKNQAQPTNQTKVDFLAWIHIISLQIVASLIISLIATYEISSSFKIMLPFC